MDAASNTGVDNMREIIESARYKPLVARMKVYIIDEVHMLSKGAFNALLKTLEEPPAHVKFIFATTEIRKVPVTVLSRCQRFDLRRVEVPELSRHFARITRPRAPPPSPMRLMLIARAAEGSVRDGLSILDQAIAMGSGSVTADSVRAMLGLADRGRILDLLDDLVAGRTAPRWRNSRRCIWPAPSRCRCWPTSPKPCTSTTRMKVAGAAGAGEALSPEEKSRSRCARRLAVAQPAEPRLADAAQGDGGSWPRAEPAGGRRNGADPHLPHRRPADTGRDHPHAGRRDAGTARAQRAGSRARSAVAAGAAQCIAGARR